MGSVYDCICVVMSCSLLLLHCAFKDFYIFLLYFWILETLNHEVFFVRSSFASFVSLLCWLLGMSYDRAQIKAMHLHLLPISQLS